MRAILVVLFMGLSTAYLSAQNAEPEGAGAAADSPAVESSGGGDTPNEADSTEYAPLRVRIVDDPGEAERTKRREDESDERERDDLAAQQSMAESAERAITVSWASFVLAVLGTIALFVALGVALRGNKIAREGNAATIRMGDLQTRAYIGVKSIKAEIIPTESGDAGLKVDIIAKNGGQTPARNVLTLLLVSRREGSSQLLVGMNLDGLRAEDIFPGEDGYPVYSVIYAVERHVLDQMTRNKASFTITGGVQYSTVEGSDRKNTPLDYTLGPCVPSGPLKVTKIANGKEPT